MKSKRSKALPAGRGLIESAMGESRPMEWDSIATLSLALADSVEALSLMTRGSRAQLLEALIRKASLEQARQLIPSILKDPTVKAALKRDIHRKRPRNDPRLASKRLEVVKRYLEKCKLAGRQLSKNEAAKEISEEMLRDGLQMGPGARNYLQGVVYQEG